MLPIEAFSIENFKSFGPKQNLSLRRINFLFGPNSSGKTSSIEALWIFIKILMKRDFKDQDISFTDNSNVLRLGEKLSNDKIKKESFNLSCEIPLETKENKVGKVEIMFDTYDLNRGYLLNFKVFEKFENEKILVISLGEKVQVNFNSAIYKDFCEYYKLEKKNFIDEVVNDEGVHEFKGLSLSSTGVGISGVNRYEEGRPVIEFADPAAYERISKFLDHIMVILDNVALEGIDWIGPNRTVSEKSVMINKEQVFINPFYLQSYTANEVNKWIEESNYFSLPYRFVANKLEVDKKKSYTNLEAVEFGVIDKQTDSFLKLSEVGSGIAHIYQILLTFFAEPDFIIIQQPEIHLHPALQVQLARAIIELSNKHNTQIIIETHSEHFIKAAQLEIAKGLSVNKPSLSQEDLSVLYISKNKDGFSNVKQMELDNTGSFTEPWPDDFFELSADLSLERLRNSVRGRN